jgi:hypothetical protein
MWLAEFHACAILLQDFTGTKQKSLKIMKIQIFVTQENAKPDRRCKRIKLDGSQAEDR